MVSQLNLLSGLLKILDLTRMFKLSIFLEKLISVLISLVRFDAATVSTFHEQKLRDLRDSRDDNSILCVSWRNMKNLSYETEDIVKNIFVTISQKVNLESVSYHLLDILENDPGDRKEIVYLINNIILSGKYLNYSFLYSSEILLFLEKIKYFRTVTFMR